MMVPRGGLEPPTLSVALSSQRAHAQRAQAWPAMAAYGDLATVTMQPGIGFQEQIPNHSKLG
jgi:hypothetical protein